MTSRFPARTASDLSVSAWGKPASSFGVVAGYGTASSGTPITVSSVNYQYVAITSTGNFTPTAAGLFDVMVIGGGGAGGGSGNLAGYQVGAGGGGGMIYTSTIYLPASAVLVNIGAGGSGASYSKGTKGGHTHINYSTVAIGGGGGMSGIANYTTPQIGAGGGGGAENSNGHIGAYFGSGNYAWDGGASTGQNAGGGGGAGGAGAAGSGTNGAVGGNGGIGYDVGTNFLGTSSLFKSGGGGAASNGGTNGTGGSGIGGTGGGTPGGSAAANTASGGGGASYSGTASVGGNGGSGIVYIRWRV